MLSPEEFGRALALVDRSGYANLEGPSEVSPEQKFLAVGERRARRRAADFACFELRTLHPALSALSVEVERMLACIRLHPLRVIHANAAWAKPTFDPSELLEIEMVMGNTGRLPLEMGNPLDVAADGWNGLRLVLNGFQRIRARERPHALPHPGPSRISVGRHRHARSREGVSLPDPEEGLPASRAVQRADRVSRDGEEPREHAARDRIAVAGSRPG